MWLDYLVLAWWDTTLPQAAALSGRDSYIIQIYIFAAVQVMVSA